MAPITPPRPMAQGEKPRLARATNLEKARALLYTRYPDIMQRAQRRQKDADQENLQVQKRLGAELAEAAKMAQKSGRQLTASERTVFEQRGMFQIKDPFSLEYYGELGSIIAGLGVCEPDIDTISPLEVKPGYAVELWGSCFGPSQGKVLFEIKHDAVVELEVSYWDATHIWATLNRLYGDLALRPYYGRIWIQTGGGQTSNAWPMMFSPLRSAYYASWTKWISGGAFGDSGDGICCNGVTLQDPDFQIIHVDCTHWGEGHAELKAPTAGGTSYSQGWHYGIPWWDHGGFSIGYQVNGPKGIDPPYVQQLGPWGWLGDLD